MVMSPRAGPAGRSEGTQEAGKLPLQVKSKRRSTDRRFYGVQIRQMKDTGFMVPSLNFSFETCVRTQPSTAQLLKSYHKNRTVTKPTGVCTAGGTVTSY